MYARARVISLPRRADRREALDLSELEVPWEFRPGIEAPEQVPDQWRELRGHYGCLLAHQAVLAEVVRDKVATLVLEDDVVLAPGFAQLWTACAQELSLLPPPDLLYLGGQHTRACTPLTKSLGSGSELWRTHAYAVTPRGAAVILRAISGDKRGRTIDGLLIQLTARRLLHPAYACRPFLAGVREDAGTDTGSVPVATPPWRRPCP